MNELSNNQKQKHEAIAIECPVQKFTFSLLTHKGLRFQRQLQVTIFLKFFLKFIMPRQEKKKKQKASRANEGMCELQSRCLKKIYNIFIYNRKRYIISLYYRGKLMRQFSKCKALITYFCSGYRTQLLLESETEDSSWHI